MCEGNDCGDFCNDYLTCKSCYCQDCTAFRIICLIIIYVISFAIVYLIYFLIFFWIDICNYCRKKHVYYFFGREETKILNNNKIWESVKFESELETVGPWICLKCNHNSHSFKDFIFQSNDLNRTTEFQNLKVDDFKSIGIISVLFHSLDGRINYAITCKKTEIFSNVEKRLLDKFPEYSKKELIYLHEGKTIDKEKSLEENKIDSGFAVLVDIMD